MAGLAGTPSLGTRAHIVTGYKGSADVLLAIEKGEVDGTFVGGWTGLREKASRWLASGEAKLLVQFAVRPDPTFRNVPVIMDYAHDERLGEPRGRCVVPRFQASRHAHERRRHPLAPCGPCGAADWRGVPARLPRQ